MAENPPTTSKSIREIMRHNAEIAMKHAIASGDQQRIALVKEWFRSFEEGA